MMTGGAAGRDQVGGLVGNLRLGTLRNSWSSATVTGGNGNAQLGGLGGQ